MSDREDAASSRSIQQAVEEGKIIFRQNALTDEERQRLTTQMLATRCRGELIRNAFVNEDEEGESDE